MKNNEKIKKANSIPPVLAAPSVRNISAETCCVTPIVARLHRTKVASNRTKVARHRTKVGSTTALKWGELFYLLDRRVHEAEALRLADDGSGEEVGLDQLQERGVQDLRPVPALVLQHVKQEALVEYGPDDWSQKAKTHTHGWRRRKGVSWSSK